MYAIIADGSRQYKVEEGERLCVDYREALKEGETLEFTNILAIRNDDGLKIGMPALANAKVVAEVLGDFKGPKLVVQKARRRKNFRKRTGHRQIYTYIQIKTIEG